MSYKHHHKEPAPDVADEYYLIWSEGEKGSLEGSFKPDLKQWKLAYSARDLSKSDFLELDLPPSKSKVWEKTWEEKWDESANCWVECPPFLRIEVKAEASVPSIVDGVAIAPKESNKALLSRLFWQSLRDIEVSPLTQEEVRQNKLSLFEVTLANPDIIWCQIPGTFWFGYWRGNGDGSLCWFNTESIDGEPQLHDDSGYSVIDACGYVPSHANEKIVAKLVAAFFPDR